MNKVITINLNGNAYQLEEDGYEALRTYLETAALRLGNNPDRDEIIADIEQAIADKFRGVLGPNKTVVVSKEVRDVIAQMGPVQDDSGAASESATPKAEGGAKNGPGPSFPAGTATGTPKRLYRIREGAQLAGVCNGLGAYLGIDVTLIRILFAVSMLSFGAGVLLYIVMMFVIPAANTPDEVAAAHGVPATAEEFIRRAKEGYYAFGDRRAFKEWKWKFKQDMRQYRREMRENARHWRWGWHPRWTQSAEPHPGIWILGSTAGNVLSILSILCLLSVLSLICTGSVCGILLPWGMPLWAQIIVVILLFKLVKVPFRAVRYGSYYEGCWGPPFVSAFVHFCFSILWLLLFLLFLWYVDHHSETAREIMGHLSSAASHTVDAIRAWWSRPS
ncbi:MAG: PspC domain-containing protein [Opitutaceae bacterium]|jgi:phage shock protein PspC (stress-responsive transcriptional regulator)